MALPSTCAVGLALALAGCPSDPECNDGFMWNGDRCAPFDAGMTDAPGDVGSSDVPCGGCTAPLVCDTATGDCEECVGDDASSCGVGGNACVANTCVDCDGNEDCTDVEASLCTAANECTGCAADPDCTHLTATPVCDEASNTCVACTIDTEAARCGANSCDPATGMCTSTPRTSVYSCGACIADSECSQANDRCVAMNFMGTARSGGYCLRQGDAGCMQPFAVPTAARSSLSGGDCRSVLRDPRGPDDVRGGPGPRRERGLPWRRGLRSSRTGRWPVRNGQSCREQVHVLMLGCGRLPDGPRMSRDCGDLLRRERSSTSSPTWHVWSTTTVAPWASTMVGARPSTSSPTGARTRVRRRASACPRSHVRSSPTATAARPECALSDHPRMVDHLDPVVHHP